MEMGPIETSEDVEACDGMAAALIELMANLHHIPDEDRHAELVAWARSDWWHPALMMLAGWQGQLARDASRALTLDLEADTPGRRWDQCDHTVGRASIMRLLGVEGHPSGYYAALPFRTWTDDDGRIWIAGAVGWQRSFDTDHVIRWRHLDIRDVILWDPRTNEARLAGEHPSVSAFVVPDLPDPRLTIWGDCAAFFRAWAANRARVGDMARASARGQWQHPVHEAADSGLPGALVIGTATRARWPSLSDVAAIQAGAGVASAELHYAAIRGAQLPQFEAMGAL